MMPVAILCGGKGTRLAPLTDHLPKYLVDVAGQPFAFRQLALLRSHGYTDIVLLIGHFGDQIRDAIGDGSALGVSVRYCMDASDATGPNGALLHAWPILGDAFFVVYGDAYLECHYQEIERVFRKHPEDALLTMYQGVDYGVRAFRRVPPRAIRHYTMRHPFQEMGSHAGLAALRARFSTGDLLDRPALARGHD